MGEIDISERLDLRGEVCPYNFVKTKLKLEQMEGSQILEITLDNGEPMKNVSRSILEEGHQILKIKKVGKAATLIIKKSE